MDAVWPLPYRQEIDLSASLMLNTSRVAFYKESLESRQAG
jgi:hypothetical protein